MAPLSSLISLLLGILLALVVLSGSFKPAIAQQSAPAAGSSPAGNTRNDPNFYVGMWVTADGYIRHELLPGGRYDEARGSKQSAYRGSYQLSGDHIDYKDDTGFTADGEFRGGVLYHGGMVLYREPRK
jgi:Agrobacterium tumefaciens protein Atu4866